MTVPGAAADPPAIRAQGGLHRLLIAAGNFFFKVRDFVFPLVFVVTVLLSRPGLPFGGQILDVALDVLGIVTALTGQALRAAVIGFAYIRRGGLNKTIYADSLVQEGFFAHSRNPLYLGNLLALIGFCLIHNSVLCYLVAVPFFAFAYRSIIAAEEDYLGRRFGAEFDAYRHRVNRLIPSFRGLQSTLSGMSFDWKRLVRKEYGSTFAGATLILALLAWDDSVRGGSPAAKETLEICLAIWIPLVACYLTARYFKKTGALGQG